MILREDIERLEVTNWLAGRFSDTRDPDLVTHQFIELLNTALLLLGPWRGCCSRSAVNV